MDMPVGAFYAYLEAVGKSERRALSRMLMVVRAGVEGGEAYEKVMEALSVYTTR
jgi:hypothetical protein